LFDLGILAQPDSELHGILFDATTAFTNVRRIQILRRLAMKDNCGVQLCNFLFLASSLCSGNGADLELGEHRTRKDPDKV